MLNSCNFMGHLVKDPKRFDFDDGNVKVVFTLAVNRNRKASDEGGKDADFFDFVARGDTAEYIFKYFHKGDCMLVTNARAKEFTYTNKDGVSKNKIEYDVGFKSDIDMIKKKQNSDVQNVAEEQ